MAGRQYTRTPWPSSGHNQNSTTRRLIGLFVGLHFAVCRATFTSFSFFSFFPAFFGGFFELLSFGDALFAHPIQMQISITRIAGEIEMLLEIISLSCLIRNAAAPASTLLPATSMATATETSTATASSTSS